MALYGVQFTLNYVAWDTSANEGKAGDVGNHTLRWIKDGTAVAPTNTPTEVDAANCPGVYKLTITATEAQAVFGTLAGKSSTSNVSLMPVSVPFERLPNVAPGGNGGLPTVNASNQVAGVSGNVVGSIGSLATQAKADVVTALGTGSTLTACLTATGFSTHNAAAVWAVGTRTLSAFTFQVTLADGSLTAAKFGANAITAAVIATDAIDADALKADAAQEIADEVLKRAVQNVEDTADRHSLGALVMIGTNAELVGTDLIAKKPSNDSTFQTYPVTTDAAAEPVTGIS